MAAEEKLNDDQRRFVVMALACYDTPSAVAAAVKEEFGVTISRQAVQAYDPTKVAGADLAKAWRDLFEATRAAFLEDSATIGIANKSVRLRMLDRAAQSAAERGNADMVLRCCEQAAKEMGGLFTNRRELGGPNGGPLRVQEVYDLTDDELAGIAASGRNRAAPTPAGASKPAGLRKRDRSAGKAGRRGS